MNTELLSRALHEATSELDASPDLADRAVRGGRRRRLRRRLQLTAGLSVIVVVMAFVSTSFGVVDWSEDDRLNQPTAGDLAGDGGFLRDATAAWEDGISRSPNHSRGIFDDLRGAPHVYWASTTPAGRTAVVLQRAFLHKHDDLSLNDADQMQTLVGLVAVDPRDGKLKLVSDQYQADNFPPAGYFRFGPGDRTVLVVDRQAPIYLSAASRIGPDGKRIRDWQQLMVTDGVAVAQLNADTDGNDARILVRAKPPAPDDKDWNGLLLVEPASGYLEAVEKINNGESTVVNIRDRRLPWTTDEARNLRVGQQRTGLPEISNIFDLAIAEAGYLDTGVMVSMHSRWWVIAGLSNGRTAVLGEIQSGDRASELYAVLLDQGSTVIDVQHGGDLDPAQPLPVAMRLSDGQGWVVAAYGAQLRFRTSAGDAWHDGGANAALLPDDAIEVQVSRPGAQPVTATLNPSSR